MSDIWPLDAKRTLSGTAKDTIRPFKCLLLMPFESRFDQVAKVIEDTVSEIVKNFSLTFHFDLPRIMRLDWVTSTGIIQEEIWKEIDEADLIFCDITGYNPNVMFELGVCAGWKEMKQLVLIKDQFFKQQSAFDIAPIRYTEYQLTSDSVHKFREMVSQHTYNVLIAFPDFQGTSPSLTFPLRINFKDNREDERIYTPPYAHRRVVDEALEFGSRSHFPYSWASIGKKHFLNFVLEFSAKFSNCVQGSGYIGVGFRSQHYYANFAYILYLDYRGRIVVALPNEEPPNFYEDYVLRGDTDIDLNAYHLFRVVCNQSNLEVQIDDFRHSFSVTSMKKVLKAGLIRFQSHMSWMALRNVTLTDIDP